MIRCLLQARRALDPSQRQLRQQQNNAPTPLRRQRLPKGLRRGAAHDAIQASARLREAPCSPESATRGILSTYKRHLLWDIDIDQTWRLSRIKGWRVGVGGGKQGATEWQRRCAGDLELGDGGRVRCHQLVEGSLNFDRTAA